jgi:CO/xanthine dehydrogenase FAD-binding subunit
MIPVDFGYRRPATAAEAVSMYQDLERAGRRPVYYAGGTEILTRARLSEISPGVVIDIKAIPETRVMGVQDGRLVLGSAVTLADLAGHDGWPLMAAVAARVADHTTRAHITLGGNLCGTIVYREAALPLLLTEAEVSLAGPAGRRSAPFADVFRGSVMLDPGELLLDLSVPTDATRYPFFAKKQTRLDYVDYPLVTLAAVRGPDRRLRVAWSGLVPFPLRHRGQEAALAAPGSPEVRAEHAMRAIGDPIVDDLHGSTDYRRFMAREALIEAIQAI